jgi:hypothetical protein
MSKILAALAALLTFSVQADTLGLHVGSWHDRPGFNNVNPGLYWVHGGAVVGAYRNSERGNSAYAGRVFESGPFSLVAGVVVGYKRRPVMPMLLPSVRVGNDDLAARISVIPAVEKKGTTVLHLSLETKF